MPAEPKRKRGPDVDIFTACREGGVETVRQHLAAGADVNQADEHGGTPLCLASQEGRAEVVKLLLAAPGIDVNQAANDGFTPLYNASWDGHTDIVKLLLAAPGIDVNQANNNGFTPLSIASQEGHVEVVKLLLAVGADVNQADNLYGRTPLYWASFQGHVEVVKLLLAAPGIDVNQAANNGYTPLFIASQEGLAEVVSMLLADPRVDIYSTLFVACRSIDGDQSAVVRRLLRVPDMDPNTRDERGFTPLMIATFYDKANIVSILMEDRRVEYHKTVSLTALELAASARHAGLQRQIQEAINRRKIEQQRWLARLLLNRDRQTTPHLPLDIVKHQINEHLDHEINTELKF